MTWWRRLLRQHALERELDAELRDHIEREVAEGVRAGQSEADVRRRIRLTSGGLDQVKEACRDVRRPRALADLAADVRFAWRILAKNRWFTAGAILTLALGIGATTAIFSVVYGVLLKPLPFDEPDRLVALYHLAPGFNTPKLPQSDATYFTYRDHARVFEDIGLWRREQVSIARSGTPEPEQALGLTDGLLSLLRVRPLLGDLLRKEDDVPGAPNRVLLTYGYWQRALGASRDVVGQSLVIDGSSYEVAGVLPVSFRFLNTDAAVLLPLKLNRTQALTGPGFGDHGGARLKPGVTLAEANDHIARMIPLIPVQFPLQRGVTQEMWQGVGLAP